ncbi:MAG: hypothetical protein QM478_11665 [Flavobacteriaceae bacterium]
MKLKNNFLLLIFLTINVSAFDFNINDDIDIPNICENLPSKLNPVNLSAACLAAQTAAVAYPPLLPAANQLCQILEGVTAQTTYLQMAVNNAYEYCDTAMEDLNNKVKTGTNDYFLNFTDINSLLNRLNGVTNNKELNQKALEEPGEFVGVTESEWLDEILEYEREPEKSLVNKNLLKKTAGAEYLALKNLNNDNSELIRELQKKISKTKTIKESQDLSMRIIAEIGFQQNVYNQLIGEYLQLESALAQKRLVQDRWYKKLLTKRQTGVTK